MAESTLSYSVKLPYSKVNHPYSDVKDSITRPKDYKSSTMQAIKLHQKPTPYLGTDSYLVPVFDWRTSKMIVRRWISHLEQDGGQKNKHVQYITLVKIPDEHLVSLSVSPALKGFYSQSYAAWSSIDLEYKKQVCQWIEHLVQSGVSLERYDLPELVLGGSLTPKCIKWTKRTRLLYSNKKYQRQQNP